MPDSLEDQIRLSTYDGLLHSLAMVRRSDGAFDVAIRLTAEQYFRVAVNDDPVAALHEVFELRLWWPLIAAIRENIEVRETVSRGS